MPFLFRKYSMGFLRQKINLCFRFTFLTSSDLRNSNLLCTCLHHREDWLKIMHKSAETMTVVERFPRLFSDGLLLKTC